MKTKLLLLTLALAGSLTLHAEDGKPPGDGKGGPPPQGGPGGGGIHVLPRGAKEKLNLTDDQMKQITELETEVKAKIEKILTSAQMEQLKQMRPPQGQGGPGGGGPGGNGGKGGGKPPAPAN